MNDPSLSIADRLRALANDTSRNIRFGPGEAFPQRALLREAAAALDSTERKQDTP